MKYLKKKNFYFVKQNKFLYQGQEIVIFIKNFFYYLNLVILNSFLSLGGHLGKSSSYLLTQKSLIIQCNQIFILQKHLHT